MRRGWLRLVMGLIGLGVFAVYAIGALGGYLLLTWLFADPPNLLTALGTLAVFVLVAAYASYRFGTARMLAGLDARELPRTGAPVVYRRLDRLCTEMSVSVQPILVADVGAPNALSLGGPRDGVIVLDRRLFELLTIDELEGILAHELAHMERYDTFVQTLAVSLVRTLSGLIVVALLPLVLLLTGIDRAMAWIRGRPADRTPGFAGLARRGIDLVVIMVLNFVMLLVLAHSRKREFAADERAAAVTGKPVALARALSKIHRATDPDWGLRSLLYIHGNEREEDSLRRLLSTHPPIEDRIDRLVDQAGRSTERLYLGRLRT